MRLGIYQSTIFHYQSQKGFGKTGEWVFPIWIKMEKYIVIDKLIFYPTYRYKNIKTDKLHVNILFYYLKNNTNSQ